MKKLSDNIREWYANRYPDDVVVGNMDNRARFIDIMLNPWDVYSILNVGDSIMRENVFDELSKRSGIDYDIIYDGWLDGKEYKDKYLERAILAMKAFVDEREGDGHE